jgi:hypothetical protein
MAVVQCLKCCLGQQKPVGEDEDEDEDVVDTDLVKVKPAWFGRKRLTRALYADIVRAPTSPERWFTPRTGWPTAVTYAGGRPENLMPTPPNIPTEFFNPPEFAVGELRVELLETDGLPKMDQLPTQANDVYALLIFEESIARTATINNVNSPKWHAECARAFRFPIFAPQSLLHVAIFDSDDDEWINVIDKLGKVVDNVDTFTSNHLSRIGLVDDAVQGGARRGSVSGPSSPSANGGTDGDAELGSPSKLSERLKAYASDQIQRRRASTSEKASAQRTNTKADDAIGRVTIDLRELHSDTVYDSWFELRRSAVLDDAGKMGAVRLRYSVSWTQPSARLLVRYLSPPPAFVLPMPTAQLKLCAEFAIKGLNSEETEDADGKGGADFRLNVLVAHGRELKGMVYGVLDYVYAIEGLFMYSDPLLSLFLCATWQIVCSYPQLLPSIGPLCMLLLLRATYRAHRARHSGVLSSPSFTQLAISLLLPQFLSRYLLAAAASGGTALEPNAATLPTQATIVARRLEAEREQARADERAAMQQAALEKALTHPEGLAGDVVGAVGSLATNILGKDTISYWTSEMPKFAYQTVKKAGNKFLEGNVLEAGGTLIARGARVATKAATTVVGSGVNTVRLAASTVGSTIEITKGTVGSGGMVALEKLLASSGEYYQSLLSYYLGYMRASQGVLTWRDPALTTYLTLVLVGTMLVLPLLPWYYLCRATGLLLLGPHMWLVGSKRRRAAAEALRDTPEERTRRIYTEPDKARRERLITAERMRREQDAEKAAKDEELARSALPLAQSASARRAYVRQMEGRGLHGAVENQGSRVQLHKLPCLPDPDRSSRIAPWGRHKPPPRQHD